MQYLFYFVTACALMILTACGNGGKDYASSAACQAKGIKPGTKEFDNCVMEEKMTRLSKEQQEREDMQEQRQQQEILFRPAR
jgi:hypothetical protein